MIQNFYSFSVENDIKNILKFSLSREEKHLQLQAHK